LLSFSGPENIDAHVHNTRQVTIAYRSTSPGPPSSQSSSYKILPALVRRFLSISFPYDCSDHPLDVLLGKHSISPQERAEVSLPAGHAVQFVAGDPPPEDSPFSFELHEQTPLEGCWGSLVSFTRVQLILRARLSSPSINPCPFSSPCLFSMPRNFPSSCPPPNRR